MDKDNRHNSNILTLLCDIRATNMRLYIYLSVVVLAFKTHKKLLVERDGGYSVLAMPKVLCVKHLFLDANESDVYASYETQSSIFLMEDGIPCISAYTGYEHDTNTINLLGMEYTISSKHICYFLDLRILVDIDLSTVEAKPVREMVTTRFYVEHISQIEELALLHTTHKIKAYTDKGDSSKEMYEALYGEMYNTQCPLDSYNGLCWDKYCKEWLQPNEVVHIYQLLLYYSGDLYKLYYKAE